MSASEIDLQLALRQTLENFERCGVRWVTRGSVEDLPQEWLDVISDRCGQVDVDSVKTSQSVAGTAAADRPAVFRQPDRGSSEDAVGGVTSTHLDIDSVPVQQAPMLRVHGMIGDAGSRGWTRPALQVAARVEVFKELENSIRQCRLCTEICNYRHQTVFGVGPPSPTICFMGEAPGADEDRVGEPFVGRAGQLLTKIIQAMQLRREDVFILNALKCRPPGNRTPADHEIDNCRPFVQSQLEVLQPQYIVCLGAVATKSLLGLSSSVGSMRGKFFAYRGAKVLVTYHPSYLLRNEQAKRLVWEDMQLLMHELGIAVPGKG
ncbi:MAG: uracil-DNA glycosylase [Pirellulaceae bacterium]|nr:uracil-DNA glycosylase [Pirellulaceae bacterium]